MRMRRFESSSRSEAAARSSGENCLGRVAGQPGLEARLARSIREEGVAATRNTGGWEKISAERVVLIPRARRILFPMGPETFSVGGRITSDMGYSIPVALGGWRERIKRLSVPYARLSDNELVERTKGGDVRRYERLVGRVIYPYAGRDAAVEDLVQETFLRAYDRLSTFNPEYRFKSWLLAIANNLGIDTLRRRRDVVEFNPELHAPLTRGPEAAAVDADRARSVQDSVMALPETYSVPLVLRYAESLTYAEIAEILDITIPALTSRLFRARNMLAEKLQEVERG